MSSSSSSLPSNKNMITLKSSDGKLFVVEEEVAAQSEIISNLIKDNVADDRAVPLTDVKARVLSKVIKYCQKHVEVAARDASKIPAWRRTKELKKFDKDFVNVDQEMLFDLIVAADYLCIKNLLDLACGAVADMLKGKSVEEIRKIFHIKNDLTPAEERDIRNQIPWAFL